MMTISLSKRGQIVGYSLLRGDQEMTLREISDLTKVSLGACSNIIRKANDRVKITVNPDLCALENIQPEPNSPKGSNKKLTPEEEKRLIELALQDATHCRMPFAELGVEAGLDPLMSSKHKADRLSFCLKYRSQNWHDIIFTDESYFETSALHTRWSRGVLRCPREAFIDRNLDRKFHGGATVMIWGAIIYGQTALLYHVYKTPYETA